MPESSMLGWFWVFYGAVLGVIAVQLGPMRVHEMLRYAYHHGVRVLFLENLDVLGGLKLL